MKKDAIIFIDKFLKNKNLKYIELKQFKIKQTNSKPAYFFDLNFDDFSLKLYCFFTNKNDWIISDSPENQSIFIDDDKFQIIVEKAKINQTKFLQSKHKLNYKSEKEKKNDDLKIKKERENKNKF